MSEEPGQWNDLEGEASVNGEEKSPDKCRKVDAGSCAVMLYYQSGLPLAPYGLLGLNLRTHSACP